MEDKKPTSRQSRTTRAKSSRTRTTRSASASSAAGGKRPRTEGSTSGAKRTSTAKHTQTRRVKRGGNRQKTDPGAHFTRAKKRAVETKEKRTKDEVKRKKLPPLDADTIRVVVLGGVEEIGRNMSFIEYRNDIIVVDCGFQFKEENTPGIDYILPNTKYLEENKHKIRGIFITHGHLDHIGGIPYIVGKLDNPPIYARNLTALLIKKRQEEFPNLKPLDLKIVDTEERIKFQDLAVKFFKVTHTIPDSMGIITETPYGDIVHTGDLKLDHVDGIPTDKEEESFKVFEKRKTLLLMADSTNVERPGFSMPEPIVHQNIEKIIRDVKGRIIVGTFASLLERIIAIIYIAERLGKKIVIDGRSMKTNIDIAMQAGLAKPKKGTIIPIEEMQNYPPHKIVMLATGAQGDEYAVLMRAAQKKHKYLRITNGDTMLFSSSVVPGNERAVQRLKDMLSRQGAKIIHYQTSDVHSSGHANRDEAMWIHTKVAPKFFVPLHGYHYMLRVHAEIAVATGVPKENIIIPDDGTAMEIRDKGEKFVKLAQTVPNEMVMVDGFAIGDIQEVVLRDRQMLAQDGIFIVIATIDVQTGKVLKSPDIISRGFVYLRESQDLLQQARLITKKTIEDSTAGTKPINFDYIKEYIRDNVGKFLFQKTKKKPMVIPVLLGI